jgi:hypothetical protein
MKLTPAIELSHREALKTEIETIANTGKVYIRPRLFTSKQDFVSELGKSVVNGDDLEVQFCQITCQGWQDLNGQLCADDPPVQIIYRLHFYQDFVQQRSDGSCSHDTFVAMLLNLRNRFLLTMDRSSNTERKPLTLEQNIITGVENEYFPGAYGHYINLQTRIEVS